MRTIKRLSMELNNIKQGKISSMSESYAKEKQRWLLEFQKIANIEYIKQHRKVRDNYVMLEYKSSYNLQSRMWKLALQDAADTMDRYWKSLFERLKKYIFKNTSLIENQKHYAFWLLKDYKRIQSLLNFEILDFQDLSYASKKKVISYLNRLIKKHKKSLPKTKLARSFMLDANCYKTYYHNGKQYISIMSLIPRKRINIPLLGNTNISGTIRVVINKGKVEIHTTKNIATVKKTNSTSEKVIAVDFGFTEVISDSEGDKYGSGFGNVTSQASDKINDKMKKRNKLHALYKKYLGSSTHKKKEKAKNIKKYNLGVKKLDSNRGKTRADIERKINTAYNQLASKEPNIIVSEDISHSFSFKYNKQWNRRLSSWVKGTLQKRLIFKALVKGFDHKQVNPAYSSQTCSICGFVERMNRNRDKFKCKHCKHENDADVVAAMNLKQRYNDPEITRYMLYREVKNILVSRFQRRLEAANAVTVNGRIPDTTPGVSTTCSQSESEYDKIGHVYV